MTNTEWYKKFHTKVELAESIVCVFASDKTQDYCAQLEYMKPYTGLGSAEKDAVELS